MRNPSKNTVKQIMRKAKFDQSKYQHYFFYPGFQDSFTKEAQRAYFLFNMVGARLYIMSKGKICNRSLKGLHKYQE